MTYLTPTAGDGLLTTHVSVEKLRSFTPTELRNLREGMVLIADVLSGQLAQSRYTQENKPVLYNAPGDVLDTFHETAKRIADAIEDEAGRRSIGCSSTDKRLFDWLLILAQAEREDDMATVRNIARIA